MDFLNFLETSAKEINKTLDKLLKEFEKDQNPKLKPLIRELINANEGGKRLRGVLVLLGYKIFSGDHLRGGHMLKSGSHPGGEDREILKVAAAIEIFQTAILAHDDIIDQSLLRRNKPTLYQKLGGDHYGISQTICLGDIGFFIAAKILSDSNFAETEKNIAINLFNEMVITTGIGEMLDVQLPHLGLQRDEADVLEIHKLKTAYYTIVYPLSIGAILAGASSKDLEWINSFGENLGIAFQIQDDILGVFGDEEKLGKSVTSDIEEGKNTLLITQALKNASKDQKEILKRLYGRGNLNDEEFEQVKQIFISTGALDYSRIKEIEYVTSAKKVIPKITNDKSMQNLLFEMADFLINRDK